jgi:hypothetical protein
MKLKENTSSISSFAPNTPILQISSPNRTREVLNSGKNLNKIKHLFKGGVKFLVGNVTNTQFWLD